MTTAETKIYAGFWRRAVAFALDSLIILFYLASVALIYWSVNSFLGSLQWLFADQVRAQMIGFFIVTLPIMLYFAISEASSPRATWGKQKVALQVLDADRERISLLRSLARTAMKFIPWELSRTILWTIYFFSGMTLGWVRIGFTVLSALIGLNLISFLITKRRQTLYDLFAGTCVVRRAQ